MTRFNEYERIRKLKKGWNISHKYSTILLNNLEKVDLKMIMSIYGSFITHLKSQKINYKDKEKYIECWKTMINTYNNSFKSQYIDYKKINTSIKQLNYVTHINQ